MGLAAAAIMPPSSGRQGQAVWVEYTCGHLVQFWMLGAWILLLATVDAKPGMHPAPAGERGACFGLSELLMGWWHKSTVYHACIMPENCRHHCS